MGLFKKKTHASLYPYDPSKEEPFLRAGTCTRELVVGFKEKYTGVFHEVMLIKRWEDLDKFKEDYGIEGDIPMF